MTTNKQPKKFLGYTGKDAVLALQHMFAMLGATVTVPILTGMSIPLALLSAGIGTIIFYFCAQKKVPVFLGSSFAFLPALFTVLGGLSLGDAGYNVNALAVMLGLVAAGLVYVILSFVIKFVGVQRIKKLFPPIVVGPVIMVIGLNLSGAGAFGNIFGSTAAPWQAWTAAIVSILTVIFVNAYAKPKSFLKVIPIILGFAAGYVVSAILSIPALVPAGYAPLIDFAHMFSGDIIVFQQAATVWGFWGAWGELTGAQVGTAMLAFVPLALVTFMEHLGDISANSVVCGKDFMADPGLDKTILGDGVATLVSGLLGGPANTTYGENTAVLSITKNYNPRNILLAAIFAVVLGMFVPFGEILASIPGCVVGGVSLVLYGMIAANGLRALVDNKVDFSNTKNMIVVSVTLVVGLGLTIMGQDIMVGPVKLSPLAICTVIAIVLNLIIPNQKEEEATEDAPIALFNQAHDAIDNAEADAAEADKTDAE